ncbi:AAA family ATPase [Moritella sp. Urea-trap-13]|uniref:AAA family ATPase n=1 Tax=Moritella sp. Urea-trap-13 TaxID=2058327 RepID=UPI000C338409|nr:AAA family ATPase [Moritella sp. Urea-trap-13]PKH06431.1 chromosome segregation protein SMC [Moritella sp. Urea-trap-13]
MITSIELENFKLFSEQTYEFNPEFNLIAGVNGSGKSSLLKALAISLAGWAHAYIKSENNLRPIEDNEIREIEKDGRFDLTKKTSIRARGIFPIINRFGNLINGKVNWVRYREEGNSTTYLGGGIRYESRYDGSYSPTEYNLNLSTLGRDVLHFIENDKQFDLPVIAFYECDRLWISKGNIDVESSAQKQFSRFDPYLDCFHTGADDKAIGEWLLKLELAELQKKIKSPMKSAIEFAAKAAMENCVGFGFDFEESRVMVRFEDGSSTPFEHLSDGQRTILGLFCDIARRAAILNPHLKENICSETKGVILIDELDLHLHPKWQRRVIEDLRKIFPKMQFICTTHSTFLIQSLRSSSELIMMDGEPLLDYNNKGIEEIARNMGVSSPEVSQLYNDMKSIAHDFLNTLDDEDLSPEEFHERFNEQLASLIAPYANNPAYQAFLERKYALKTGEEL